MSLQLNKKSNINIGQNARKRMPSSILMYTCTYHRPNYTKVYCQECQDVTCHLCSKCL